MDECLPPAGVMAGVARSAGRDGGASLEAWLSVMNRPIGHGGAVVGLTGIELVAGNFGAG